MGRTRRESYTEDQEMELRLGPHLASMLSGGEVPFQSEDDRRAAWEQHRDRLCRESAQHVPGSRPWMLWHDEGIGLFDRFGQIRFLVDGGYLYPDESRRLIDLGKQAEARIGTAAELWSGVPNENEGDALVARVGRYVAGVPHG